MGLKCSILGHAYEPAGVDREREERGSEVVTVVRELERCDRCGAERVVSESTEITAVVDADDVGIGEADPPDATGLGGAVDRSEGHGDASPPGGAGGDRGAEDPAAAVDDLAEDPADPEPAHELPVDADIDPEDPEKDDAEILTDDEPGREPGQWPEEAAPGADEPGDGPGAPDLEDVEVDDGLSAAEASESADEVSTRPDAEASASPEEEPDEESLSGITVPDGHIVCPECDFRVEAHSGYREGDPCPECRAWLTTERNP